MINARSCAEIIADYTPKQKLSKYALKKIPLQFQSVLTTLAGNEVSCDCHFESDDGRYLYMDRNDGDSYVLIARSGQGDEWLLHCTDNKIYFLDHCIWEDENAMIDLTISLEQFIVMADLLKQFETLVQPQKSDIDLITQQFLSLSELLPQRFPFTFC